MSTEPIEVFHGITRLVRGGAQIVVLDLLRGLDRTRYRPVLIVGPETGDEGSLWSEAEELDIEIIRVPTLVRSVSPLNDLRALFAITRLLRHRNPGLVHAHTSKAGFLLCRAARWANTPAIVFSPHGHIARDGAEIPGVPSRGVKKRLLTALARRSIRDADVVICPNDAEREDGIAHGMWTEDVTAVVPNGIDTDQFVPGDSSAARSRWGLPQGVPIIGVVARLTREKGVDIAIEALQQIPEAHLVIVGDGPERVALERQLKVGQQQNRATFLGLHSEVHSIYPALDVLIVPSRTEAHGLVAAEALSCEIPVVASDLGGLRNIVEPGKTGKLVPAGDGEQFAQSVRHVLNEPGLARRLGRAGRQSVIEKWSLDRMIRGTEELYDQLLPSPRVNHSHGEKANSSRVEENAELKDRDHLSHSKENPQSDQALVQ